VNITSVRGRIAEPFTGAYASTKYATEAFSDILRLEMKKFGVSVSIVEPGNFGGATDSINVSCSQLNRCIYNVLGCKT
jgi:3-hydroxybutyrate dehydrogenase